MNHSSLTICLEIAVGTHPFQPLGDSCRQSSAKFTGQTGVDRRNWGGKASVSHLMTCAYCRIRKSLAMTSQLLRTSSERRAVPGSDNDSAFDMIRGLA
jgi:hypothetical protein